jgi:hypothetical protein
VRDPERVCGELRAARRTAPEERDAPVLSGTVRIFRIAVHLLEHEEGVVENVPNRRARSGVVPSRPDEREGAVDATAGCA